ncbi:MAG: cation diffusion facilitator family transporter [Bacteroidales bacterium]|jgi:cation diffusion facilitator family transporter|nr:cation diffusion facilitator family transporter [Bacteroidales bacterium]
MAKIINQKIAFRAGWLAVIGNVLLFFLKLWVGVISGSVALMADAWHTLSDSASSIILMVFYRAAAKPPDTDHPFGHGRFRLVASVIIGAILIMIGLNFGVEAVQRLISGETTEFGLFAIVVTAFSMIVKEAMARYSLHAAKKLDSLALKADAWHHRSDAISSLVILVGIFLQSFAWWIDGVLGLLVAALIMWTAWKIIIEAIDVILGKNADGELIHKVRDISNDVAGFDVLSHHFHLHSYGDHNELSFHIVLHPEMPLRDVNQLMSEIRNRVRTELDVEPTIQVDANQ